MCGDAIVEMNRQDAARDLTLFRLTLIRICANLALRRSRVVREGSTLITAPSAWFVRNHARGSTPRSTTVSAMLPFNLRLVARFSLSISSHSHAEQSGSRK